MVTNGGPDFKPNVLNLTEAEIEQWRCVLIPQQPKPNIPATTGQAMWWLTFYIIVVVLMVVTTFLSVCLTTTACESSYFHVGVPFTLFGAVQHDVGLYAGLCVFFFISAFLQVVGAALTEISFYALLFDDADLEDDYGQISFFTTITYSPLNGTYPATMKRDRDYCLRFRIWCTLFMVNVINACFFLFNLMGTVSNVVFFAMTTLGVLTARGTVDWLRVFRDATPLRCVKRLKGV
jgi:hypothetical protein